MRHRLGTVLGIATVTTVCWGAGGSIDTTGATFQTGTAQVQGAVVVNASAQLGAPPAVAPEEQIDLDHDLPYLWNEGITWAVPDTGGGLGGPDFSTDLDLTLPGGTYDFGTFTVGQGVTVHFTGAATIRVTDDVRVDGRIEMDGSGALAIRCGGDATFSGHAGGEECGVFADDPDARVVINAAGRVTVESEPGTQFTFSAQGPKSNSADWAPSVHITGSGDMTCHRAVFRTAPGSIYSNSRAMQVRTIGGDLLLTDCTGANGVLCASAVVTRSSSEDDRTGGHVVFHGGVYRDVAASGLDVRVDGECSILAADSVRFYASGFGGGVTVTGRSQVRSVRSILLSGPNVTVEDGALVQTNASLGPNELNWRPDLALRADGAYPAGVGQVRIGEDAAVENRSDGRLLVDATQAVVIEGTLRGDGVRNEVACGRGDIEIGGAATIVAENAPLRLWAGGAVFATGGEANLSAFEYDVRCTTGDLDLDVNSMEATDGRIVALSKGLVRLRGSFTAARDIQVLSVLDSVDVSGATLRTTDVETSLSGFIRLATYAPAAVVVPEPVAEDEPGDEADEDEDADYAKPAAASDAGETYTVDASGATLLTGSSPVRSGDVIVAVAADGAAAAPAKMSGIRSRARRTPTGIVTDIRGLLTFRGAAQSFDGTTRVTAGTVSRRIYLGGGSGQTTVGARTLDAKVSRGGSRRFTFALTLTEESAAPAGRISPLGFDRAGLHVRGTFRRPRVRGR